MLISAHAAHMGCNIPVPVADISTHTALRAVTIGLGCVEVINSHFYSHGSASRDQLGELFHLRYKHFYSHGSASRDGLCRSVRHVPQNFYSHGSASRDLFVFAVAVLLADFYSHGSASRDFDSSCDTIFLMISTHTALRAVT